MYIHLTIIKMDDYRVLCFVSLVYPSLPAKIFKFSQRWRIVVRQLCAAIVLPSSAWVQIRNLT